MKHRFAATIVAAALLFAACGGGDATSEIASLESADPSASETTEAVEEVSMEDGLIAFTECLREEGIEIGDPTVGLDGNLQMAPIVIEGVTEGVDGPDDVEAAMGKMDAVFTKCEPLLGEVAFTNDELPGFNEFEDLLLEYAGCMRDNGVDMADPDFSADGGVMDLGTVYPNDPAFQDADEACHSILAGFGPIGG